MDALTAPVSQHMHAAVFTISISASVEEVAMEMSSRNASALVVVDDDARPVGVVSLTDLVGLVGSGPGLGLAKPNPYLTVRELFTADPVCVEAEAPLREAAELMVRRHVHRLMVVHDAEPAGVLSVTDLLRPLSRSELTTPIGRFASVGIVAVQPSTTVGQSIEQLKAAGVRSLVVMDGGWPVGSFGQREALAARDAGTEVTTEHWMSPAVVCLPAETPVRRAAAQALAMHAPLIVTLVDGKPVGVLTATDLLSTLL